MNILLPINEQGNTPLVLKMDIGEQHDMYKVLRRGVLQDWEPEVFSAIYALLKCGVDHAGTSTFYDIGANLGFYSLAMRLVFGDKIDIHAFEPCKEIYALARKLKKENAVEYNLYIEALSSKNEKLTFYVSSSDSCSSLERKACVDSYLVNSVRLDDFVAKHGIALPKVIKIDVEGHEDEAFKGAAEVIARHKPAIIAEVLAAKNFEASAHFLKSVGYKAYLLKLNGDIEQCENIRNPDKTWEWNWLFLAEEASAAFQAHRTRCFAAIQSLSGFVCNTFYQKSVAAYQFNSVWLYLYKSLSCAGPALDPFPLENRDWHAYALRGHSRCFHYEFLIQSKKKIFIGIHLESQDKAYNSHIRTQVSKAFHDEPNQQQYDVVNHEGAIGQLGYIFPFSYDYAMFDFYASIMTRLINRTYNALAEAIASYNPQAPE